MSNTPAPAVRRLPYNERPDYTKELLQIPGKARERLLGSLAILYGEEKAAQCYPEVERILQVHCAHKPEELRERDRNFRDIDRFTERDVVAITYGDLIHSPKTPPLAMLRQIFDEVFAGTFNVVHLLPFFPYSSDRGFSVIDYMEVDPHLGTWADIHLLGESRRLMFDGVVNHVSSQSHWFREFLNGNPWYENFFISFSTKEAISPDHLRLILRPRTSSLLTAFPTLRGVKHVWTTFSPDQIDLNYRDEKVLFSVLEVLLYYVRQGADILRLDAATYLWRELGTSCAHLKQTHALIQFFRAVMDVVAPTVGLITETNVPHEDNISYFGDGHNEAHMVYNFALPPLVLWTLHSGDCTYLARWAASLHTPSPTTTFFNFLDSHDGIGLLPIRNILSAPEVQELVDRTYANGGLVSMRTNSDGTTTPYELNIPWYNAINPDNAGEDPDIKINRFLASRAIALAMKGVAAVYLPSIIGAHVTADTPINSKDPRSINRNTINAPALFEQLQDSSSAASRIAQRFSRMISLRVGCPAFHPAAAQRVLFVTPTIFSVYRESLDGRHVVLCLTNITSEPQEFNATPEQLHHKVHAWTGMLIGDRIPGKEGGLHIELKPYEVRWLKAILASS
ncbi:MAG: sugar phosphorylase [Bryobacterales bacterium]|nr:sugar phosphorylase [Bryobacterales bacterium]